MISWKHSFKRLNEEYELTQKKKQALDSLYENGKISQATRDSFDNDINAVITEIEKQQNALLAKMQEKTQELESQITTLERLLANYEIQHVVGEIEEEMYQREITLISTGLESARHELNIIKEATSQLCPTIDAPIAEPDLVVEENEAEVAQDEPTEDIANVPAGIEAPEAPVSQEPAIDMEETASESPSIENAYVAPEDTPQIVEETPEVAESQPEIAEEIPQNTEDVPQETEWQPQVTEDSSQETTQSLDENVEMVEETPEVAEELTQEVENTAENTEEISQPEEEMPQATEELSPEPQETECQSEISQETTQSLDENVEMVEETPEVAEELTQEVENTAENTEEISQPEEEMPQATEELSPDTQTLEETLQTVEETPTEVLSEASSETPQEIGVESIANEEQNETEATEAADVDDETEYEEI